MIAAHVSELSKTPFAYAAGRGVRIAVVDSGINPAHPHICAPTKVVAIRTRAGWDIESGTDTLGHGTAVMAPIQEKAPGADYFVLKLFGPSFRATTVRLLEAMEWAIDSRMDVVNLSLGTTNLADWVKFQTLAVRDRETGVALVCARSASIRPLLRGALPDVIGVDVDWDLPRHRYRIARDDRRWYFFASGYPRPLPRIPPTKNLRGISFAVANMTGFVARACEGLRKRLFETVREALAAESFASEMRNT